MKNHLARTKKAMKTFFRLFLTELIIYFILTPDFFEYVPILDPFFHWLNSIIIPTGAQTDNVFQFIINFIFGWIPEVDILMSLIKLIAIIIPIGLVFSVIIHLFSLSANKVKIKRMRKQGTIPTRKVKITSSSHILSLVQKLKISIGHKNLQKETEFSFDKKDKTYLRIQEMKASDNNFNKDRLLSWNSNSRIEFGSPKINAYILNNKAFITCGNSNIELKIEDPIAIYKTNECTGQNVVEYVITWIGG